jgi:hypothetical protein
VGLDVSAKTIGSALTSNCIIVNVTSRRLEGMLERRGYKKREVPDGEGGTIDEWRRGRTSNTAT